MKKNLRRALTALLAMLLLVACSAPAAMAESFKAKINSSSSKVYAKPSSSSKSIKGVKGVTVKVTAYEGDWARISYKGNVGYMKVKYLDRTDRIKAYAAEDTSVYKRASSSSRLGRISRGTAVYVIGMDGDYFRVQNKSGSVTGYVHEDKLATYDEMKKAYEEYKDKLEEEKREEEDREEASKPNNGGSSKPVQPEAPSQPDDSESSASAIDRVISLAKSLIGRPYASSDNPPSSFNCSSFVKYCMEVGGDIDMKSSAKDQSQDSRYPRISSVSSLKKGDILFFDTDENGSCDHSAIYIGGGDFIECSQNAAKVQINELDSWYEDHFLFARRPS